MASARFSDVKMVLLFHGKAATVKEHFRAVSRLKRSGREVLEGKARADIGIAFNFWQRRGLSLSEVKIFKLKLNLKRRYLLNESGKLA